MYGEAGLVAAAHLAAEAEAERQEVDEVIGVHVADHDVPDLLGRHVRAMALQGGGHAVSAVQQDALVARLH